MISGVRQPRRSTPSIMRIAAVAMMVRGHSAFTATRPSQLLRQPEHAKTHAVLAEGVGEVRPNHFGSRFSGGASTRMCGAGAFSSAGRQACATA